MIIIGTGAVAAEITMFFPDQVDGYLEYDYNIEKYYKKYNLKKPVLGDVDTYEIKSSDRFVLGFADVAFRRTIIDKMISRGARFMNLIHYLAIISRDAHIGTGNVIYPQCIISVNAMIQDFNLLTCQSIISHDCTLGSNNILATTLLCGHVHANNDNSFGIKSTVIPHINIGSDNVIQAGQIVDKHVGNDQVVFHRFRENVTFNKV